MPHTYNTSSLVSMATKQALHEDGMLSNTVGTGYSSDFTQNNYVSGQSITIEIEPQASITEGRVGVLQNRKPKTVTATLGQYNGVFETSSIQKAYDQKGEAGIAAYGRTIGLALLRKIETTGFLEGAKRFGAVGVQGSEPGSYRTWAQARARIRSQLADGRLYAAASPDAMTALADAMKGASNPNTEISQQYKAGEVKNLAGLDFYETNSTYRHTAGTADNTTPLVDGTPSNGDSTLHIDGTTNGDIVNLVTKFTVGTAGSSDAVYACDPEDKKNLPYLYKFSVISTSDASSGSGDVDLTLAEPMYDSTDTRQNMSQLPQDGATITFDTEDAEQAQCNMVYAPDALELISVPLAADSSGALKEKFETYNNMIIRTAIHPRDAINDVETLRVDACWAWTTPRPNHGQIVWGK